MLRKPVWVCLYTRCWPRESATRSWGAGCQGGVRFKHGQPDPLRFAQREKEMKSKNWTHLVLLQGYGKKKVLTVGWLTWEARAWFHACFSGDVSASAAPCKFDQIRNHPLLQVTVTHKDIFAERLVMIVQEVEDLLELFSHTPTVFPEPLINIRCFGYRLQPLFEPLAVFAI